MIVRGATFRAERPWGSRLIGNLDGVTVKVHWTDQPYKWHVNDGKEVFVVLDGEVIMHRRVDGRETSSRMTAGDAFYADLGCEHYAEPVGEARVLVIEREGSI